MNIRCQSGTPSARSSRLPTPSATFANIETSTSSAAGESEAAESGWGGLTRHNGSMRPSDIARTASIFSEVERQRGLLASLEPTGLRRILLEEQRRNRMFEDLSRPSSLRMVLDQQLKVSHLLAFPTYTQMGQQTKILVGLMERPTLLAALGGLSDVPKPLIDQARRHREDLYDEVAGEVAAEDSTLLPDVLERLAEEREATILICLKRFAYIAAAGGYFGVYRIPNVILGLIVVFLVIGEVADEILGETEQGEDKAA